MHLGRRLFDLSNTERSFVKTPARMFLNDWSRSLTRRLRLASVAQGPVPVATGYHPEMIAPFTGPFTVIGSFILAV